MLLKILVPGNSRFEKMQEWGMQVIRVGRMKSWLLGAVVNE
jgi:hypothetical protein